MRKKAVARSLLKTYSLFTLKVSCVDKAAVPEGMFNRQKSAHNQLTIKLSHCRKTFYTEDIQFTFYISSGFMSN
jgi:hypothetical protein